MARTEIDAVRISSRAGAADVPVTLEIWPHMIHAWHLWAAMLEAGRRALDSDRRLHHHQALSLALRTVRTKIFHVKHVWMPPFVQEVFERLWRVIGRGHVSGLQRG